MDLELRGRVAVVTGGSKGIGLAAGKTLIAEGAYVVSASRRTSPGLEAIDSPNLIHAPGCFMDDWVPETVVTRAVEAFGGLDILVNNAGGPPPGVARARCPCLSATRTGCKPVF